MNLSGGAPLEEAAGASAYEYRGGTAVFPVTQVLFDKAAGTFIYDTSGREYVDLSASFGSLPLGHNHPEIVAFVQEYTGSSRMMTGYSDVYSSRAKAEFIAYLGAQLPPEFNRVALTVTGSDAVELALKTAAIATGKPGVLVFAEGYHGLNIASTYLTGMPKFRAPLPQAWFAPHVRYVSYGATIAEIVSQIRASQTTASPIGQMIIEPILGRAGVRVLSRAWLIELKRALQDLGCVLIYDEVFVGIGRTGTLMCADAQTADLACFAKAIGGGMPLGCVVGPAQLMDQWPLNEGEALHTGTYYGHALSCGVAHKSLEIMLSMNLIARAAELGDKVIKAVRAQLSADHPIRDVRGKGLMLALDLQLPRRGAMLADHLRCEHQLVAIPSGTHGECLSLSPALLIAEEVLLDAIQTIMRVAAELTYTR